MKHYPFPFLCIILAFINADCSNNPVTPPDNTPGRRDYTWTVDTLKANPGDLFHMSSLWGSNPTDIWAVGSADASDLSLWHYDGVNWSRNTSRLSSNLMCVYGFAQNDVWMTDAPGKGVYHFNGQQWSNVYNYTDPGTYLYATNIWGESSNNIYVAGAISTISSGDYKGTIMHYDGNTWNFVSIPDYKVGLNRIRRGRKESNKYYISGTRFESTGDTNKLFELEGNSFREINSGTEGINVNEINGRMYFTQAGGKQILKYANSGFQVWKDFTGTDITLGLLWGRNEMDIFTQAYKAGVYGVGHYNGTDWVLLYQLTAPISDIAIFKNDIFILYNHRIIIHGKIQ
jgi:hypothetical protein